jgi:hypothetical protein
MINEITASLQMVMPQGIIECELEAVDDRKWWVIIFGDLYISQNPDSRKKPEKVAITRAGTSENFRIPLSISSHSKSRISIGVNSSPVCHIIRPRNRTKAPGSGKNGISVPWEKCKEIVHSSRFYSQIFIDNGPNLTFFAHNLRHAIVF